MLQVPTTLQGSGVVHISLDVSMPALCDVHKDCHGSCLARNFTGPVPFSSYLAFRSRSSGAEMVRRMGLTGAGTCPIGVSV